ncbi:m(4)X modification enzyme TRM13 homolog [Seminavis robusta]|uniref:tRNA:m(4)X modification enzyme TRM13 n=1 Tax=Seminavis robusta TaxID=568900 RepID=A0A9N8D4N7_9STRA|nr:m(4)X modification enzyme TRM13 homolog [Seminavis robusta]|eukprot:Sro4_g003570.1 m(4)X modification enzyme TRM13 homolog (562) ;mRNA; r:192353-194038
MDDGTTQSLPSSDNQNKNNKNTHAAAKRTRIPCPLDPTHTIYKDMLARHLKICPKAKLQREIQSQPFYRQDVNTGGHGGDQSHTTHSSEQREKKYHRPNLETRAKALALRILVVHQHVFGGPHPGNPQQLTLEDIEQACTQLPLKDCSDKQLQLGLAQAIDSYHIRSGGPKHLQQQASLLGHLQNLSSSKTNNNNNNSQPILMLELGAGRGMLGLVAAGSFAAANRHVDLIMMERAGTRSKADTILRNHKSKLPNQCINVEQIQSWQRLQCDLAHVHMPTVLELHKSQQQEKNTAVVADKETPTQANVDSKAATNDDVSSSSNNNKDRQPFIMAIAKHLCGAGTDLALKALYPIRDQLQVCLMATCCHGVCTWEHYVGRDYLASVLLAEEKLQNDNTVTAKDADVPPLLEFGPEEFEMMRLWSSGTVKDDGTSSADNGNNTKQPANSIAEADNGKRKRKGTEIEDETHCDSCTTDSQLEGKVTSVVDVVNSLQLSCGVQGLGRACQRLLDYGRKQYLEQVLFAEDPKAYVDLCYYVPSSVTPQNAVFMASRQGYKVLADPL